MKHTILIIEDKEDLLELLEYNLQKQDTKHSGFYQPKMLNSAFKKKVHPSSYCW